MKRVFLTLLLILAVTVATQVTPAGAGTVGVDSVSCNTNIADANAGGERNTVDGWYSYSGWFQIKPGPCWQINVQNIALEGNGYPCVYQIRVRIGKFFQDVRPWHSNVCSQGPRGPIIALESPPLGDSFEGKWVRFETRALCNCWYHLTLRS